MTEQFDRLHGELRNKGGFSEHIPTASKPPSGKFMVSDYGSEDKVPKVDVMPSRLEAFAKGHSLDAAPKGVYMGGWSPSEGDHDYLDVSRAYPDEQRGRLAMTMGNQMSMYDTSKPATDPKAYIDNPHYEEGATPPTPWLLPSREPKITLRSAGRGQR